MDKEKTLESIQNAVKTHENQMTKIDKALKGDIIKDPTAKSKTECEFGKWLYAEDNHLRDILGSLFYDKVESLHAKWHREYLKVYDLVFLKKEKKGFFSKLTGASTVSDMDVDKARLYYSELQQTTKELLAAMASSERRLSALPETKFY
ncbi:MAG: CZB domain-containing protein [Campylobacterota bacterium]|nr:CZB domain-containing protein [Campylobacterota bacterium]